MRRSADLRNGPGTETYRPFSVVGSIRPEPGVDSSATAAWLPSSFMGLYWYESLRVDEPDGGHTCYRSLGGLQKCQEVQLEQEQRGSPSPSYREQAGQKCAWIQM